MIMSLSRRLAAWLRPLAKECIAGAAVAGAAAGAVCAVVLHRRLTATRAALDAIEERLAAHSTGLDFLAQELEALRLALRQPQLAGSSNSSVSGRPVRSVGGGSRTASMATAEDEGLSEAGWSDAGWSEAGGYRTADEEDLDDLLLSAPAPFSHKPPPPLHGAERVAADSDADADGASAATPPRGGASAAEEEGASSAAASAAAPSSALAARVQEAATLVVRADEAYAARETGLARSLLEEASALGLPDAARAEVRWRLARTLKELADEEKAAGQAGGSDGARKAAKQREKSLMLESLGAAREAVELDGDQFGAHKWYAIALSITSAYDGVRAAIEQSFTVREHFEAAVRLAPADATSRHLLGLWFYEVAGLSWATRKVAAALFATPPTGSHAEALAHFEAAEALSPGFYLKNQVCLAKCSLALKDKPAARRWLASAAAMAPKSADDEASLAEAKKLLASL